MYKFLLFSLFFSFYASAKDVTLYVSPARNHRGDVFTPTDKIEEHKLTTLPKLAKFKDGSAKVVASKRHDSGLWVIDSSNNTEEKAVAESPLLDKGLKSWVICVGEFKKEGGHGNKGGTTTQFWKTELTSPCNHVVFANFYKELMGNATSIWQFNTSVEQMAKDLKKALDNEEAGSKCYIGYIAEDSELGENHEGEMKHTDLPPVDSFTTIQAFLNRQKIEENSVATLWSIGHGFYSLNSNSGQLILGDKTKIIKHFNRFNKLAEFIYSFLKPDANIWLHHCQSGGVFDNGVKKTTDSAVEQLYDGIKNLGKPGVRVGGMIGQCLVTKFGSDNDFPKLPSGSVPIYVGGSN